LSTARAAFAYLAELYFAIVLSATLAAFSRKDL